MRTQKSSGDSANVRKKKAAKKSEAKAMQCYQELAEKSGWTDSELLSNALRVTYAAYRCGQIKLLNEWLKKHDY